MIKNISILIILWTVVILIYVLMFIIVAFFLILTVFNILLQVAVLEATIYEKKRQVEKLVNDMKEANLQSLAISPPEELKIILEGTCYSGYVRKFRKLVPEVCLFWFRNSSRSIKKKKVVRANTGVNTFISIFASESANETGISPKLIDAKPVFMLPPIEHSLVILGDYLYQSSHFSI